MSISLAVLTWRLFTGGNDLLARQNEEGEPRNHCVKPGRCKDVADSGSGPDLAQRWASNGPPL